MYVKAAGCFQPHVVASTSPSQALIHSIKPGFEQPAEQGFPLVKTAAMKQQ
jgi:hypothetical protein